jgi:Holliday junction resolvase RusA-like endonuclease
MPWRAVDQRLRPWKDAVTWVAKGRRKWAHQVIAEHGLPLVIRVTIPFPVERRRDPHNYTSTVVKAVVDGLVAARWVNDDTAAWIEVADSLLVVGGNPKVEILLDAQGGAPE